MDNYIFNAGAFAADIKSKVDADLDLVGMEKLSAASKGSGVQVNTICLATFPDRAAFISLADFMALTQWLGKNPADYIQQVQPAKLW